VKPAILACAALFAASPALFAAAEVTKGFGPSNAGFKLDPVLPPALDDAASKATFSIIDGQKDGVSADLAVLNDGKIPTGEDQPASNFFFANGSDGGRIGVDLGSVTSVRSIATYSWHNKGRGPQLYKLYGADGRAKNFDAVPKKRHRSEDLRLGASGRSRYPPENRRRCRTACRRGFQQEPPSSRQLSLPALRRLAHFRGFVRQYILQ